MSETDEMAVKLTRPVDFKILDALSDGRRDLGANIAIRIDEGRGYVNTRLPDLKGDRLVERVGPADNTGLYQISERGVAALVLRDSYDDGPEWEQAIDDLAEDVEIVGPEILVDGEPLE